MWCSQYLVPCITKHCSWNNSFHFKSHTPLCFRTFCRSGRSHEQWWRDRCRHCHAEKNHWSPSESCSGARRVELPEDRPPDHRVREPGGPTAHGRKELWQTSVEQPSALRQLGHLKHGPAKQYWSLQSKTHFLTYLFYLTIWTCWMKQTLDNLGILPALSLSCGWF